MNQEKRHSRQTVFDQADNKQNVIDMSQVWLVLRRRNAAGRSGPHTAPSEKNVADPFDAAERMLAQFQIAIDDSRSLDDRITETVRFCEACREACELTDVDAMERARDRLKAELQVRRQMKPVNQ
jgi:hypothetical protein